MSLLSRRRAEMGLLLTTTLAVAAVSAFDKAEDGVVEAMPRRPQAVTGAERSSDATAMMARLDVSLIKREAIETVDVDVFAPKSWQPAPPPPAAVVPPAPVAPSAPPLPFTYVGQMEEAGTGKVILYLSQGETVYPVAVGDLIDEQYRLEAMDERQLTFSFLPLKTKQVLAIPAR